MEQHVLVNMVLKISCGKTAATFTCELVALHPLLAPEDTLSTPVSYIQPVFPPGRASAV